MAVDNDIWENMIAIKTDESPTFNVLERASYWRESDRRTSEWDMTNLRADEAAAADHYPLPEVADREGYFGPDHFSYWASGLRDMRNLLECCERNGLTPSSYLDLGCASGRVIRHFAINRPDIRTHGCDINRRHIEWVTKYLPSNIVAFQNHSIPTLPLEDSSIDLVTAFSVFTHIEAFELAWLMEIRRILRPGGLAWVTVHTEKTWDELEPHWPLYKGLQNHPNFKAVKNQRPMLGDRLVFRWHSKRSYSANVFYNLDYLRNTWGRILAIKETHRRLPGYQDVVILVK